MQLEEVFMGNIKGPEGLSIWTTATQIGTSGTTASVNPVAVANRTVKVGDLVISSHANSPGIYGRVTAVSSQTSVTVSYVGNLHGIDGTAGKGISSTTIAYQAGTSGTTAPTGAWGSSIPSVSQGQFLWTRTIITYTDNTTSTTYSVSRQASDGANLAQVQSGFKLECRNFRTPVAYTISYLSAGRDASGMLNLGNALYVKARFTVEIPDKNNPNPDHTQHGTLSTDSNVIFAFNYFGNVSIGANPDMSNIGVSGSLTTFVKPGVIYVPNNYVGHYLKYDLSIVN